MSIILGLNKTIESGSRVPARPRKEEEELSIAPKQCGTCLNMEGKIVAERKNESKIDHQATRQFYDEKDNDDESQAC